MNVHKNWWEINTVSEMTYKGNKTHKSSNCISIHPRYCEAPKLVPIVKVIQSFQRNKMEVHHHMCKKSAPEAINLLNRWKFQSLLLCIYFIKTCKDVFLATDEDQSWILLIRLCS